MELGVAPNNDGRIPAVVRACRCGMHPGVLGVARAGISGLVIPPIVPALFIGWRAQRAIGAAVRGASVAVVCAIAWWGALLIAASSRDATSSDYPAWFYLLWFAILALPVVAIMGSGLGWLSFMCFGKRVEHGPGQT